MAKKSDEEEPIRSWREVPPAAFMAVVRSIFSKETVVSATFLWFLYNFGITWLLPPADRAKFAADSSGAAARLAGDAVQSPWFAYGGWGVAAVVLLLGVPYVVYQHRRIQQQGAVNAQLRPESETGRLSSRNPQGLAEYAAQSRDRKKEEGPKE